MNVRPLEVSDRDAAVALWADSGLTRPWNDPVADFDRAVAGPASAVLGAFDEKTMVATVMVGDDGHRGWVYYLAVDEHLRGAGLGRRLMAEAERWLLDRGTVKLNLMVRHSNSAALGFYDRAGYVDAEVTVLAKWLTT